MLAPQLTSFATPQGGGVADRETRIRNKAPQLTSFATPQGGGVADRETRIRNKAPQLASFARFTTTSAQP